jgi:ferrous iron transport protein B
MELKLNPKIVLIGNLNCGKSSLFNNLTGLSQKTGNYPGTTIAKKRGCCKLDEYITADIIDLPGTDSLYPETEEEKVVFDILNNPDNPLYPDIAIVMANATKLNESLLLMSQVKDLGIPVVLALNMVDIAEKAGIKVQPDILRSKFGVQVVKINARSGEGLDKLKYILSNPIIKECNPLVDSTPLAPEIIELAKEKFNLCNSYKALQKVIGTNYNIGLTEEEIENINEWKSKYSFNENAVINQDLEEREALIKKMVGTFLKRRIIIKNALSVKLDAVFTHPVFGYVIFVGFLFLFSIGLFALAAYPSTYISGFVVKGYDIAIQALSGRPLASETITTLFPILKAGVSFIPHLLIFFAIITLLEESGYMARVVLLMDKATKKSGLNGKCLVPFFSGNRECLLQTIIPGFGSNDKSMISTFISSVFGCPFQLPVHIILIVVFVPDVILFGSFNLKGLVLFASLIISFLIVLSMAYLTKVIKGLNEKEVSIKDSLKKTKNIPSVIQKGLNLELPNYSLPKLENFTALTFNNLKVFTMETGKVLFWMFAVCWALILLLEKLFINI